MSRKKLLPAPRRDLGLRSRVHKVTQSNSLFADMALRGFHEITFAFSYADGKDPSWPRYTTIGKVRLVRGKIVAEFVAQKIEKIRLFSRLRQLFLRRD
jgi:hypothetical protein